MARFRVGNRLEIQVDRPQILIGHESVHRPRHDLEDAIAFISVASCPYEALELRESVAFLGQT